MAKVTPYKQQVDYTSKISVGNNKGNLVAAQNELSKSKLYSALGSEFNTMVVDNLKAQNINEGTSLAKQLQYGKKNVSKIVDGETISTQMTSLIYPVEQRIRGDSGLKAYKKQLARDYTANLSNDLLKITEDEANRVESEFGTMEEFATIASAKHSLIYENIDPTIANELRADAEKKIISRGSRVQNVHLAEQHKRASDTWDVHDKILQDKIFNAAKINDNELVNKLTLDLKELNREGSDLNIRKAIIKGPDNVRRINNLVSGFNLINKLQLQNYSTASYEDIQRELVNTENMIMLLSKAPNVQSMPVHIFFGEGAGETQQLTAELFNKTFDDPELQDAIGTELKNKVSYLKNMMQVFDSKVESASIGSRIIGNILANTSNAKLSDSDMEKFNPNNNQALINVYNKRHQRNLTIQEAPNDMEYQIFVATAGGQMHPTIRKEHMASFNTFDTERISYLYNSGYLGRLSKYIDGAGQEQNMLLVHYGDDTGTWLTRMIRGLDNGTFTLNEFSETFTKEKRGEIMSVDSALGLLGTDYTKYVDLEKEFVDYYNDRFGGNTRERARSEAKRFFRKIRTSEVSRVNIKNFDVEDYIYDIEKNKLYKHQLTKSEYVIGASQNVSNPLYYDGVIKNSEALSQFALPPQKYIPETQKTIWDPEAKWNLDWVKEPLLLLFNADPLLKRWTTETKYDTVEDFVNNEFGRRIKLIPIGINEQYQRYNVVKVNDDGDFDYVLGKNGRRAELDLAPYYKPAYRNVVSGNNVFRSFIKDLTQAESDHNPQNDKQDWLGSWEYWARREWDQHFHGINKIMPDGEVTMGEGFGAFISGGLINKYLGAPDKPVPSKIPDRWGGKYVRETLEYIKEKRLKFTKGSFLKGGIVLGLTYLTSSQFAEEIEDSIEGFTGGGKFFDMDDPKMSYTGARRFQAKSGPEFNVIQDLENLYSSELPPYEFKEDYINNTGDVINAGTTEYNFTHIEKHPDLGWIAVQQIKIIDGKRVFLSESEAMAQAVTDDQYILLQNKAQAINYRDNIDSQIRHWSTSPNQNWWLNGIEE